MADVLEMPDALTADEIRVLHATPYGWRHIDRIAAEAGMDRADAERDLRSLAKKNRVAGVGLEWARVRR